MGQEQQRVKDENATGRDLPDADGSVSQEDVNAIDDDGRGKKTGQDHSLDDYGETIPDDGVTGAQNRFDTTSDVARVEGE